MSYQNSSIAAIQAAIIAVVLLKVCLVGPKYWMRLLAGLFIVAGLFLIMLLQSRTAVLAAATGALYVSYPYLRNWYTQQKILFVSFSVLAVLLIVLASTVKTGSSAGRRFIWKNCFVLLKEHWLSGVGFGKFNPAYNHIQAQYFSSHSLTDSTALRANDGYYAFNEWLQMWIEAGIGGFLAFLTLTGFISFICLRNVRENKQFYGPVLIPLLVACIFSYPLHNFPLFLTGILFSLIGILDYSKASKIVRKYLLLVFVLAAAAFSFYRIDNDRKINLARNYITEGYMREAYAVCQKNLTAVRKDYQFSTLYLDLLYNTGRTEELIKEFDQIHPFHCNQTLHSTLGKTYHELNDSIKAREHFLTALYIAPYRLQSRMDLLQFYKDRDDLSKARYWANQIVDCPMKILSAKGVFLKEKAKVFSKETQ